jgi:hypothetical protein
MTGLTVETYNAGDVGTPSPAHFIHITERPSHDVLERYAAARGWALYYPDEGTDALIWDTDRLDVDNVQITLAWKSGREHGQPGTTPRGYVLSWWGTDLLTGRKVAFVGAHLVNNAFGAPIRGERRLRRALWKQGWAAMGKEAQRLRRLGYVVFKLGDLNRRPRYWPGILARSIGAGYDRIVYPPAVDLRRAWRGPSNGSDHKPLVGEFGWKR